MSTATDLGEVTGNFFSTTYDLSSGEVNDASSSIKAVGEFTEGMWAIAEVLTSDGTAKVIVGRIGAGG